MYLVLLLLPLAASAPSEGTQPSYTLDIQDGVLKNVALTGDSIAELDLSGMQLRALEKNSLDNVSDLKSLNLANNSLKSLPDFLFSNMTKLEYLSLAENQISKVKYLFVGLESLRVLNISCNPIVHLRRGHLFGMSRSVSILTEGNVFWSISTGVFANSFLKEEEELKDLDGTKAGVSSMESYEEREKEMDSMEHDTKVAMRLQEEISGRESRRHSRSTSKDHRLKLCMSEGIVKSLEILAKNEAPAQGCFEVSLDRKNSKVNLRGLGIRGFHEGWYQLQSLSIASVDLSKNEISEITRETLNDLPADLVYVNLLDNRIRRIWRQVIENEHLRMLNLKDNLIEEIEEGALRNMNLTGLFLSGNQLESLNFVSSLPRTLTEFVLTGNQIASIPKGAFSNLSRLFYLNLGNNKIVRLVDNVFEGLDSLQVLILTRNSLQAIEAAAFEDLKSLRTLFMYRNLISDLRKGTFAGLENLKDLNLAWNKFAKISKETFADMPRTLDFLYLDFNEIEKLEEESFVEVPRFTLSLNGNKISSIPRGAFNLPSLQDLYLNNNTLTTIDGDSYEGLPRLKRLWLSENQISAIHNGACKNLGSLNVLDISKNPFQRLENGALYGLTSARGSFLYVYNNSLKELQGGVFDEI
ncbi:hypothetical protein KM043_018759 [Ampulex compressa]|nr:hypothetical protein KM043_018759 [Ampulex compressa]